MTVDSSGVPVSDPIPSSATRVASVDRTLLECESASGTGTDERGRMAAQGAAQRARVRGCSPRPQYPDAHSLICRSAASSCSQLDAAWKACAPPLPPLVPRALSATYWGSSRAARRGRGQGLGLGPASERLQRAGDPKLQKAGGAVATFQVGADRSSRSRRAAEGGLGTWTPL